MSFLLAGLSLGFAAGISPGPLMTLVITRTLERGLRAGLRVAIAPLLTDAPIILVTVLFFTVLPPLAETLLTIGGGFFVLYLGGEALWSARDARLTNTVTAAQPASADIWRGVMVNLLSPNPWLFWISVGSPTLVRAWESNPLYALAFLAIFYVLLVGGKATMALAIAGGRRYLTDSWYRRLLVLSALVLAVLGAALLWQGVTALLGYN
ncbi:MAG: LysE family transporter [Caldilineaceae bacterium]|nr:LysE family transporter [Caldilineaceae bacterium]